jgi:membrane protease YdiL (CAAX protease family)
MKTVLVWGLYFAVVNIVQVIVVSVFSFFNTFAAMSQDGQIDPMALMADLTANLPYGWMLLLSALAGVPVFLILRGKRLFTEDLTATNERVNAPSLLALLAIILGCAALLEFTLIALESILQLAGLSLPSGGTPPLEAIMSPLVLLYVVLVGPIVEEVIFRGAILRALRPYGANFAIVISALLFALTHVYLYQAIFAFLVGLLLGYCATRFSLKWAVLLHIINNGVAMASALIDPTGTLTLVLYGVFFVLAIIAGVWGYKKLAQQRRDGGPTGMAQVLGITPNPYAEATGVSTTGAEPAPLPRARPLAIAFSSPWLIAAIALILCLSALFLAFGSSLSTPV